MNSSNIIFKSFYLRFPAECERIFKNIYPSKNVLPNFYLLVEEMKRICFMTILLTSRQQWQHVNMLRWGICCNTLLQHWDMQQYCCNTVKYFCQQFLAPFRSRFGAIITIVGSWQCVHLKDQVLSFKMNGHLWKSVKNWLQKWVKSNVISISLSDFVTPDEEMKRI